MRWESASRAQRDERIHRMSVELHMQPYDIACYFGMSVNRVKQILKAKEALCATSNSPLH